MFIQFNRFLLSSAENFPFTVSILWRYIIRQQISGYFRYRMSPPEASRIFLG